jgi:hypothetical protein
MYEQTCSFQMATSVESTLLCSGKIHTNLQKNEREQSNKRTQLISDVA